MDGIKSKCKLAINIIKEKVKMFYMSIMMMMMKTMMRRTENLPCRSLILYIAHVILQCLHYLPSIGSDQFLKTPKLCQSKPYSWNLS